MRPSPSAKPKWGVISTARRFLSTNERVSWLVTFGRRSLPQGLVEAFGFAYRADLLSKLIWVHAPSKLGGHSTDPRPTIVNRPLVDVLSIATLNRTDSTEYSV